MSIWTCLEMMNSFIVCLIKLLYKEGSRERIGTRERRRGQDARPHSSSSSRLYATRASTRCTCVLKLLSLTCSACPAAMRRASLSDHSMGISASRLVYARMVNAPEKEPRSAPLAQIFLYRLPQSSQVWWRNSHGSSSNGRKVQLAVICLMMADISALTCASVFLALLF